LFKDVNNKIYDYSLTVPKNKANAKYLMQVMQSDLKNYFGFTAKRIKKAMPVYYLEVADEKRFDELFTVRNQPAKRSITYDHLQLMNTPIGDLVRILSFYLKLELQTFNNTGRTGNINIDLRANMVDEVDTINQLKKNRVKNSEREEGTRAGTPI
jgi:uncharacterized protein (TIGR03435 family)